MLINRKKKNLHKEAVLSALNFQSAGSSCLLLCLVIAAERMEGISNGKMDWKSAKMRTAHRSSTLFSTLVTFGY